MELIKKESEEIIEIRVINFDPGDTIHFWKMKKAFDEAGIIYPDMNEFISIFEKQGIHFIIEDPAPEFNPEETDQADIDAAIKERSKHD